MFTKTEVVRPRVSKTADTEPPPPPVVVKPDTAKDDEVKAFLQRYCGGMNHNDAHAEASRLLLTHFG